MELAIELIEEIEQQTEISPNQQMYNMLFHLAERARRNGRDAIIGEDYYVMHDAIAFHVYRSGHGLLRNLQIMDAHKLFRAEAFLKGFTTTIHS